MVNFMKSLMNKYFLNRLKTITQRRLHSPWITTGIMKCIRQKYRWFSLLRNGWLCYNAYKVYVKKLRLLLRTTMEQYFVRRVTSPNSDMKKNWKVLNGLMGKKSHTKKSSLHWPTQKHIHSNC